MLTETAHDDRPNKVLLMPALGLVPGGAVAQHAIGVVRLSVSTLIDGLLITLFDGRSGGGIAEREPGIRRDLRCG